ncbi:MAG: hypothetical protein KDA53_05530 [Hyphomonas sp.]|nr:hypothetical protein [Hyphomonas sp.]
MGGPLINCMHDSDADGQFDTGWGGGNAATENDMLAFSVTKKTLSAPTSYETVDPALGPRMPVEIKWAKSGNAGTITFRVEVGGRRIASTTKAVPAKGAEPVEVKLFGAVILLEGYDAASESIRVQVQEGIGHNYMRIPAVLTITYY